MTRYTWSELPPRVRAAIERETGPVLHVEQPSAGRNSDFSAALHLAERAVFCKGIADRDSARARMHRHEADVAPHLPRSVAPSLLWRVERDGWLLLGFEHVTGQHADLSPGSADLPLVADTVTTLARELARGPIPAPRLVDQWARLSAWRRLAKDTPPDLDPWARAHLDQLTTWEARGVDWADGTSLVHTDLHPLNILVGDHRARVVDWAWSRTGAATVDAAFLIARLVACGHTPAAAEQWADELPMWRDTPPAGRTAFAVVIWGIWEFLEREHPLPHRAALTAAARAWARYRLTSVPDRE